MEKFMKKNKRVTYSLPLQNHLEICKMIVEEQLINRQIVSKSYIVQECLINTFKDWDDEIDAYNKDKSTIESLPKQMTDNLSFGITLPVDIIQKVEYYATQLKVNKSLIVYGSVLLYKNMRENGEI